MSTAKPVYALMVAPETAYGAIRLRAYIVRVEENGEFRTPGSGYTYDDGYLEYFEISAYAYASHEDRAGTLYGLSADYRLPFRVDLTLAEGMVKLLRKVTRGIDKLNESEGYVQEGDYAAYLLRVARILSIRTFYVRNDRTARDRSGERWRRATASVVQSYADTVREAIAKGNVAAYDN